LTVKPAASKSCRWFSQLGSLIQTSDAGEMRRRKSAPIFRPPVPPRACTVTMLVDSLPNTRVCTALSYAASPSIGR
jgi:hypothetical protein